MDKEIKKVYCCANELICAAGKSTSEVLSKIEKQEICLSKFQDGTPAFIIDRAGLNLSGLEDFTYTEQLLILALQSVVSQSGLEINSPRTALILSTTKGNIDKIDSDFELSYLWKLSNRLEKYFHLNNKSIIISNACVSGITAIAIASRMIEKGEVDNVFVAGVDTLNDFIVSGFNSFKSVSPIICKPYDKNRDGLTPGEGSGALLLSSNEALSSSKIVVSGYGMSNDANHISGPSRTGDGLYFAIDKAMKLAQIDTEDVGLLCAHGTATLFNDEMESKAFALAKIQNVPCNSLKPYFGHTYGAAGIIESIISIEEMCASKVFGVNGYKENGVPNELNVTANHRNLEVNHCVKCASGFGGTNAAIVLSKEAADKRTACDFSDCNIEKIANIHYCNNGENAVAEQFKSDFKELGEANLKFYKMSNLAKAGYVASCKMLKDIELPYERNRIAVVIANSSASLDTDLNHQEIVNANLPEGASPAVFVYTLPNIVAGEIAIKHKFQGELTTFIMEEKSMDFLSDYSEKLIKNGECEAVLYGWCELLKEEFDIEFELIKKI